MTPTSTAGDALATDRARALWRAPLAEDGDRSPGLALALARDTFLAGERIEMRTLAGELGIGRSTLYRWFGDRDRLIGAVLWGFTSGLLEVADDPELSGAERIVHITDVFGAAVAGFEPLRRFLTTEPEAALRVLTTHHGGVQERTIDWFSERIAEEITAGHLATSVDADALAYAVVRVGEGFLYADQITGVRYDPEAASAVIRALLGS